MKKNEYRPRIIDKTIDLYLSSFGAVCIEGVKWCGKTCTSLRHSNSSILLGDSAGDFQNKRLADLDPKTVLEGEKPRLIDEWQEVPKLWDAVRYEVDSIGEKGQFLLTGSATPPKKGILHSGAGRIGKLRMRTMSLYESGDSTGDVSLESLCKGELKNKITGEVSLRKIIDLIVRGGWPSNIDEPMENACLLPESYINAIVDNDVNQVDITKRDKRKIKLLLRSLARNESTTVSNKKLKNDIKEIDDEDIDLNTVATYLDIFDRLFITDNQEPFSSNLRSSSRIKKSEKRHLADPSLACSLLDATPEKLINDLNTLGFLFESLCERDLKIYAESFRGKLYHYQDYDNDEIDAIVELKDGDWCAFEIKLGANQIDEAAKNLIKIKNKIEKNKGKTPVILCVICGLSNVAYKRPDGVFVVPITALKD